jgi:hypothetical protein
LYPVTVDVLGVQDKLTLCCGAGIPVPVNDAATGGLVALLVNVIVAEAAPLAWGANLNVKGALWPTDRVTGKESPVNVNSGLLELTEEMVTLAPLAVIEPVWFCVLPTVTLPKLAVAGFTASCPGVVPVADRDTLRLGMEPSAVSARLPLTAPPLDGVNVTLNVRLCPALSVVGTLRPLVEKPPPVTVAVAMCSGEPPELVRRSVCD